MIIKTLFFVSTFLFTSLSQASAPNSQDKKALNELSTELPTAPGGPGGHTALSAATSAAAAVSNATQKDLTEAEYTRIIKEESHLLKEADRNVRFSSKKFPCPHPDWFSSSAHCRFEVATLMKLYDCMKAREAFNKLNGKLEHFIALKVARSAINNDTEKCCNKECTNTAAILKAATDAELEMHVWQTNTWGI